MADEMREGRELIVASGRMQKVLQRLHPPLGLRPLAVILLVKLGEQSDRSKGLTVSELGAMTHQQLPAISRLVKELDARGLVVRRTSEQDHRVSYLTLSEAGWSMLGAIERHVKWVGQQVEERMGERDSKELRRLLDRLADILDEIETQGGDAQ